MVTTGGKLLDHYGVLRTDLDCRLFAIAVTLMVILFQGLPLAYPS